MCSQYSPLFGDKQEDAYVDLKARLCVNVKIQNFHLFTIPIDEAHIGVVMFDMTH